MATPSEAIDWRRASEFIRTQLPMRPVAGAQEVRLHLATPSSGLRRLARMLGGSFQTPYWAYPWAGGVALARHLLDHPEQVAGRRVFDLGAGGGLVAIAAALAGAASVEALDVDPLALVAADLNAEANGVRVSLRVGDATTAGVPDADLVCAGDLFYAPDVASASRAFLQRCREAGAAVLIGDPWRADLPRRRLSVVQRYAVPDFGAGATPIDAAIFALAS